MTTPDPTVGHTTQSSDTISRNSDSMTQMSAMTKHHPGPNQSYPGRLFKTVISNECGYSQTLSHAGRSCTQPSRRPTQVNMISGSSVCSETPSGSNFPMPLDTNMVAFVQSEKTTSRTTMGNVDNMPTQSTSLDPCCATIPYSATHRSEMCVNHVSLHPKPVHSVHKTGDRVHHNPDDLRIPEYEPHVPSSRPSTPLSVPSIKDLTMGCVNSIQGLPRTVAETTASDSPFSVGSACSKSESWQSSCDSWESAVPGSESENRLNSGGMVLSMEVVDVKHARDRDLSKVMDKLTEAVCKESGNLSLRSSSSLTSTPPDLLDCDGRDIPDGMVTRGSRITRLRKTTGLCKNKHTSKGANTFRAKRSLEKASPELSDEHCLLKEADASENRLSRSHLEQGDIGEMEVEQGSDINPAYPGDDTSCYGYIVKKNVLCQVCGDIAAGFYCGAYICEACKKFFVRATHQFKMKYVCHRSENCEITKETRVRCQYCRYQKCIKLNMYSPGEGQGKGQRSGISNIPCRVCGGASSGFHFGALTCEGCKGFFRRMAKERELNTYRCVKDDICEINMLTRNVCKSCRFRKCLEAGMSVEGSRIGRQPNAVKHAISVEAQKIGGMKAEAKKPKAEPSSVNRAPVKTTSPEPQEDHVVVIKEEVNDSLELVDSTVKRVMEAWKELSTVYTHDKFQMSSSNHTLSCNNLQTTWKTLMMHFEFNAKCIIKFSKKLPNFQSLGIEDQVTLIQMATYPICILNHCQFYDLQKREYRFFDFNKVEEKAILKYLPEFSIIPQHFMYFGEQIKCWHFDDIELAFLTCLILINTANVTLKNQAKADDVKTELSHVLAVYIESNHTEYASRMKDIEKMVKELCQASLLHNQCVAAIAQAHPELENQLWDEMYLK